MVPGWIEEDDFHAPDWQSVQPVLMMNITAIFLGRFSSAVGTTLEASNVMIDASLAEPELDG